MTNKEAIEQIKNIKIFAARDGYTDEAMNALDKAIKSLEMWEDVKEELNMYNHSVIFIYEALEIIDKHLKETENDN